MIKIIKEWKKRRIILNARGVKFEVLKDNLKKLPNSRLGKLEKIIDTYTKDNHKLDETFFPEIALNDICDDYDLNVYEFYFDKDPFILNIVLNYYSYGKFHIDQSTCAFYLNEELKYWGLDKHLANDCCFYKFHRGLSEIREDLDKQKKIIDEYLFKEYFGKGCIRKIQEKIYHIMEDPKSSWISKIYFVFSYLMVLLSLMDLIIRSLPEFRLTDSPFIAFEIIEIIFVSWFTIELLTRFIVSPKKLKFFSKPENIIDLISVVPFYAYIALSTSKEINTVKNIARILRSFSILKIFRVFKSMRTLGKTLINSYKELLLLVSYLFLGVLVFSSIVFYFESEETDSMFDSIPSAMWWGVVTITTIGYGDLVPTTVGGKIFGSMCAIFGIILVALPIALLANNFNQYYRMNMYETQIINIYKKKAKKENRLDVI